MTNTANAGPGSLREAILSANLNPGADAIVFQIPTSDPGFALGVFTIAPQQSPLPSITDIVTLDAATQTAFTGDTNPLGPEVAISGSLVGGDGLQITSNGSTISGLVIQGFSGNGITINGSRNTIRKNYIGTDGTGSLSAGNGAVVSAAGIAINSGTANVVGGSAAGNLISGNGGPGISIISSANIVQGNLIGTDRTGSASLGNGGAGGVSAGVLLQGAASQNLVGGASADLRNVISGNAYAGIIFFVGPSDNLIQGNYIGTDATGTSPIPNFGNGVYVFDASSNQIGGAKPGEGNLISGNHRAGVQIYSGGGWDATGNHIAGNLIGTDKTGVKALANWYDGVELNTVSGNYVGGGASERNIIAGNLGNGVSVFSFGPAILGNFVQGNLIGNSIDSSGNPLAVPNGRNGIAISAGAESNLIGGTTPGTGNVISGNAMNGIAITPGGFEPTGKNQIQGNNIGVDATGTDPIPNGRNGVFINGVNNLIGGPGAGNVIAQNKGDGVLVVGANSKGNVIRGNSLYGNAGLAIGLLTQGNSDGTIIPNDPLDLDLGPNNLQNFPVLASAATTDSASVISGTLNTAPSLAFIIDVYATDVPDSSGHGGAKTLLSEVTVVSDRSGAASFTVDAAPLLGLQFVTATAIRVSTGDTSEFAQNLAVLNLKGDSADQAYTLGLDSSGKNVQIFAGAANSPIYSFSRDILTQASFDLAGGSDSLTIDFSNGNPLPSGGLRYDGGAGSAGNTLHLIGTAGNDIISIQPSQALFNGIPIALFNVDSIITDTAGGNDTLSFNGGTFSFHAGSPIGAPGPAVILGTGSAITLDASSSLASLAISNSSRLTLKSGGKTVLRTAALVLGNAATLDIGDNAMVVQSDAANRLSVLAAVSARIGAARGVGQWTGFGITSTAAAADAKRFTGLAAVLNDRGDGLPFLAALAGEAVDANAVIVKYTLIGDMDLSGTVDADDYFLIDRGFRRGLPGYQNGDLDYSGSIDSDDFALLDRVFASLARVPHGILD